MTFPSIHGAAADEAKRQFNLWFAKVNAIVIAKTGVHADDLPDYCYFDDGATPSQAARRAIRAAKEF